MRPVLKDANLLLLNRCVQVKIVMRKSGTFLFFFVNSFILLYPLSGHLFKKNQIINLIKKTNTNIELTFIVMIQYNTLYSYMLKINSLCTYLQPLIHCNLKIIFVILPSVFFMFRLCKSDERSPNQLLLTGITPQDQYCKGATVREDGSPSFVVPRQNFFSNPISVTNAKYIILFYFILFYFIYPGTLT